MPLHVLIVDRNKPVRDALTQMVSQAGCEPVALPDAAGALGALTAIGFDALVAGVSPGDDSVSGLVDAARRHQPDLRIIVGRAYALETDAAGLVDAYMDSPVTFHVLRVALQHGLQRRRP